MSEAVLKFVNELSPKTIYDDLKKYLFKPDTSQVDAIFGGYDQLLQLINEINYGLRPGLIEPMGEIYTWTGDMEEVITGLQKYVPSVIL
jgi:hypothetical protein